MAHLYKPQIVRWILDGKRVKAGTPGAKKVIEEAAKWYAKGPPFAKPVPLARDRGAAEQMMARKIRAIERGEAGLEDSVTAARKLPLADHLAEWEQSLRDKGDAKKTVGSALTRVRSIVDALGWTRLDDLDRGKAEREMARRRALPRDAEGHVGPKTSNYHLAALCQFAGWLVDQRPPRLASNPIEGWHRQNAQVDVRRDRRELTAAELAAVLQAALDGPVVQSLAGRDRHALYLAACGTGLRASALASLTPASFRLDEVPPVVQLAARKAKNRKPRIQPLPPALAEFFRGYLAGRDPATPIWPGWWCNRAAELLRVDLEAAGVPYTVEGPDGPLHADFHSLRHTYGTRVGEQADERTTQELMDHSTPNLTARYSHRRLARLAEGVAGLHLPGLGDAPLTREQMETALMLCWSVLSWLLTTVAPGVTSGKGTTAGRLADGIETDREGQRRE